jgi:carbonic anhydrase
VTEARDLIPLDSPEDILLAWRNTPIATLLEYQNFDRPFEKYDTAQLLVGMCMDNRKHLHIPENFAFIIRSGGANLRHSEFKVSYAIGVGGVRHIALLAHTQCGMSGLANRRDAFIKGLVDGAGWSEQKATDHFHGFAPLFEIGDELDFVRSEARRLRERYPRIMVAPLLYKVEDNRLYQIRES